MQLQVFERYPRPRQFEPMVQVTMRRGSTSQEVAS
jgi:hypothetical protein